MARSSRVVSGLNDLPFDRGRDLVGAVTDRTRDRREQSGLVKHLGPLRRSVAPSV
jgi:hypothetical protein